MGSWGFEDTIDSQAAGDFVAMLLKTLWKHRQQNRHFMLYEKFPWYRLPQPDFHYIRLIDWKKRCAEEETFVEKLLQQFVDGLTGSYVRVTPDYLVGWVYRSVGSTLSGQPDYYCVMPLGYINVEVSLPKPDWKPFIIGHVLKEMLTTALRTTTPGGGPYLQHRWYLHVHGRDAEGTPLELAFDWYGPGDSGYEEAQFVIRFVQR